MFRHAQQRDRRAPTTRTFAVRILAIAILVTTPFLSPPAAHAVASCGPNQVMIGWFGDGVTCLDANGWSTFVHDTSDVHVGQIQDIAVCADGTAWVADTWGLVAVRNGIWSDYQDLKALQLVDIELLACAPAGGVFVGGFNDLGYFDGTNYSPIDVANLGTQKFAGSIKDLVVSQDGSLWVLSTGSIARLKDGRWQYWMNGRGYSSKYDYYFSAMAVDRNGVAWAAASSGLLRFSAGRWVNVLPKAMSQPQSLAVDAKNRLWVGMYSKGLAMYSGKGWTTYTIKNSGLASNNVTALSVDGSGRLWIGTDWGISILAGTKWSTYRMESAETPANDVHSIAVMGRGPSLPAKVVKAKGTLIGRLILGGVGQPGLTVEVCSQFVGSMFFGKSPCESQVFHKLGMTGADGRFSFTLPTGKYGLTYKSKNGKWVRLTDGFKIGSREMLVPAGGSFDLGDLDLAKAT